MSDQIIVAIVAGAFSVIVTLLEFTRRQNNNDHANNSAKLDHVIDKLDRVDNRVSSHIEWHVHQD